MTPMEIDALYHGLSALRETGLLASLSADWATAAEHAARTATDPHATELLLQVFEGRGMVQRRGDRVRAAPSLASYARGFGGRADGVWSRLEGWLRTGATMVPDNTGARGAAYSDGVVDMLARMFAPDAQRLAATLATRGISEPTVLDVGCGSGVFGLAVLECCGGEMIALDLPDVLPRTRHRATSLGLADQLRCVAGDYHQVELPQVDLAILANVLHLEPADRAQALLERVMAAVRPGGHVVIVDALTHGEAERQRARAAYAVHLALRLQGAFPHADETLVSWLETGCTSVSQAPLNESLLGTLVGVRAAPTTA